MIAVILVKWAWYARMIRGIVRQYSHRHYIAYAPRIGAPPTHILRRHLLPVTLAETIVLASSDIGSYFNDLIALFISGLGGTATHPEWGNMLRQKCHGITSRTNATCGDSDYGCCYCI